MGVTYKLRDEVVDFIISQRQSNPLASCRQLAESASEKFSLQLSKSSVYDVLKESGIIMARGRKPKDKFEIPQEKKRQIQSSLSQVKLLPDLVESHVLLNPPVIASPKGEAIPERTAAPVEIASVTALPRNDTEVGGAPKDSMETSPEYEGAGRIFLKAALWDLGIFSEENIKETDWDYYLTYSKGVNVVLENGKSFFIDLELPIERCIREVADGLINNVKPFIVHKVTDESLFKACMEGQMGFKMTSVSIVEQNDHVLSSFYNIMEFKRKYILKNRSFVVNKQKNILERSKSIFISQKIDKNEVVEYLFNLRGFDSISRQENTVNLVVDEGYAYKNILQEAMERLNGMYICDEQGRLVSIKF